MKRTVLLLVFVSFCLCLPVVLSFIFLYLVLALIRSPPISFDLSSVVKKSLYDGHRKPCLYSDRPVCVCCRL